MTATLTAFAQRTFVMNGQTDGHRPRNNRRNAENEKHCAHEDLLEGMMQKLNISAGADCM